MVETLVEVVSKLAVLGILVYALLIIVGAPFGGPNKFANPFVKWLWRRSCVFAGRTIKFPFKFLLKLAYQRKQKKKNGKKKKK